MIIERKPKSALVEEVLNFKKDDKETVVEEVKPVEEEQKVVEGVVSLSESQEIIDEKVADVTEATEIKPAESVLNVKVEEKKCENCIECDDRKAVAEQVKKLKEQHIKHKITKKDDKFIIECFGKIEEEKKESLKEEWQYCNCKDLDEVAKLSDYCAKNGCKITAKTSTNDGYKCRIEGPFDNVHKVNDKWSMFKWKGTSLEESKELKETWAGEDVIDDIVDRAKSNIADGADVDDAVFQAIDEGLIYNKDIYALLEHYGSIDTSTIIESYYDDLYSDVVSNLDIEESLKEDKKELDLKTAIKVADDTVLDDTFGKDTAERKLAQEIKDDKSENLEEAKSSVVDKIKSKILKCLDRIGYNEKDFEEYFVIEEKEFVNDEGDKATHIQIRNDLVDFYEAESYGLITELDKIVEPGYFEPYDAYVWDAYIWENEVKEDLHEDLDESMSSEVTKWWKDVEDANVANKWKFKIDNGDYSDVEAMHAAMFDMLDELKEKGAFELFEKGKKIYNKYAKYSKYNESLEDDIEIDVEEPTVDEVDDEVVYFSTDEVKDVVEDVVDKIGDEMKDKEPEEVDVEEIIDEKITDAVEEKKEESEDVEDDVSGLEDEEEISVDFSDDDISEEDAQFLESLEISNNYKNESKTEEQQKLDEELGEVVIKDDLGVAEDLEDASDLDALVDMIK